MSSAGRYIVKAVSALEAAEAKMNDAVTYPDYADRLRLKEIELQESIANSLIAIAISQAGRKNE